MNSYIIQRPLPPNKWLYKGISEDERWFTDEICRPVGSEPWPECTDAEKQAWESNIWNLNNSVGNSNTEK